MDSADEEVRELGPNAVRLLRSWTVLRPLAEEITEDDQTARDRRSFFGSYVELELGGRHKNMLVYCHFWSSTLRVRPAGRGRDGAIRAFLAAGDHEAFAFDYAAVKASWPDGTFLPDAAGQYLYDSAFNQLSQVYSGAFWGWVSNLRDAPLDWQRRPRREAKGKEREKGEALEKGEPLEPLPDTEVGWFGSPHNGVPRISPAGLDPEPARVVKEYNDVAEATYAHCVDNRLPVAEGLAFYYTDLWQRLQAVKAAGGNRVADDYGRVREWLENVVMNPTGDQAELAETESDHGDEGEGEPLAHEADAGDAGDDPRGKYDSEQESALRTALEETPGCLIAHSKATMDGLLPGVRCRLLSFGPLILVGNRPYDKKTDGVVDAMEGFNGEGVEKPIAGGPRLISGWLEIRAKGRLKGYGLRGRSRGDVEVWLDGASPDELAAFQTEFKDISKKTISFSAG